MKVKICGITSLDDLKSVDEFSPSFIGFINVKRSKRFLPIYKIRKLKDELKNPEKSVLVLEPEYPGEVIEKSEECEIANVQLHSLSPEDISKLKKVNVIKAIGIDAKMDEAKIKEINEFSNVCNYLLFDSMISGNSGGTGNQIPLEIALKAAKVARMSNPKIKLLLAGGMNIKRIKNEGSILAEVFDYFDVNSGVEDAPGIKNRLKIKKFIETCMVIQ